MEEHQRIEFSDKQNRECKFLWESVQVFQSECINQVSASIEFLSGIIQNPVSISKDEIIEYIDKCKINMGMIPPNKVEEFKELLQKVARFVKDNMMGKP